MQSNASFRRKENLFVIEGLRICKDAFDNGIRFDKLIISDTAFEKYSEELSLFEADSDELYKIPDSLFKKISDTSSPQGIIAVLKMDFNKSEIDLNGRYIALENIQDPSNLGAISRTAEAFGVSGILLSQNSCDPYSPKSLRASMGTILRMPVIILEDFADKIKTFKLKSFACVVDSSAVSIKNVEFSDGSIVIIGNEANGITEKTKQASDTLVTIPMKGNVESLNAAVAASVAIWEMMK